MLRRLLPPFLIASPLLAQDGQQLYTLYCSACHGADGKGATGGTFPPLSESPYVAGDPDRSVKIVLKGLTGPVDVLGKTYNLKMPPQGAALPDDQIAAILTYVRSAWGNQAGPVTTDQVKTIRAAVADRAMPWTAPEILKLHPLPLEKTVLTNLTSRVYRGEWKYLPDFSKLKAENIEEEHDGVISLTDSPYKENYAMVWEGTFEAATEGDYYFRLDAAGAARIIFDGTILTELNGFGPMDGSRGQGDISTRTKGPHSLRVEYLQNKGPQGLAIGWKAPGSDQMRWLTDPPATVAKPRASIPLAPTGERPVIYRNFIDGTTPRSIGVGFPGGLNLAYSADNLAPELLWTGKFIDGAAKWLQRGTDKNPPAGENVIQLTSSRTLPKEARFKGYKLDAVGNPTFKIQIGEQPITDFWQTRDATSLERTLVNFHNDLPIELLVTDQPVQSSKQTGIQYGRDGTPWASTKDEETRTTEFTVLAIGNLRIVGNTIESHHGKWFIKIPPRKAGFLRYDWIR